MPQQGDDLSGRDLSGSDFSGADLGYVDLSGADLSGADLSGAKLRYADLTDADLKGADLTDANLKHTTLVGADLTDATLAGARMKHATLEANSGAADDSADDLSSTVGSVVVFGTLLLGIGLLFAGWSHFWIVFVIGFAAVLPLAGAIADWYEDRTADAESAESAESDETDERTDALAELRQRYADGEIDEAEFEHRVEPLLKTESMGDAEDAYGGSSAGSSDFSTGESESDSELERELE